MIKSTLRSTRFKKVLAIVFLILQGALLLIYPYVLIGNVMSIANFQPGSALSWSMVSSRAFIVTNTIYPITYLVTLILYIWKRKFWIISLPFIHLLLCLLFAFMWYLTE